MNWTFCRPLSHFLILFEPTFSSPTRVSLLTTRLQSTMKKNLKLLSFLWRLKTCLRSTINEIFYMFFSAFWRIISWLQTTVKEILIWFSVLRWLIPWMQCNMKEIVTWFSTLWWLKTCFQSNMKEIVSFFDTSSSYPVLTLNLPQISKRKKKMMFSSKQSSSYDKAELILYEEVARMPPFMRKTLVLVGCQGVGRRTIKNRIINSDPSKFGTVIPRE